MSRFPRMEDDFGRLRKRCDVCGTQLEQPTGRGRSKRYCGPICTAVMRRRFRREDYREKRRRQIAAATGERING